MYGNPSRSGPRQVLEKGMVGELLHLEKSGLAEILDPGHYRVVTSEWARVLAELVEWHEKQGHDVMSVWRGN